MKLSKILATTVGLLGVLFAASPVAAQSSACESKDAASKPTIAELRDVQGNVLVSDKTGMQSGTAGQRIENRARVMTTSPAAVTIVLDCGCNIRLKENERVDVELPRACGAMLASVTSVTPQVALGASASAASTSFVAPVVLGAVGVGGYLLYRSNRNVSPN